MRILFTFVLALFYTACSAQIWTPIQTGTNYSLEYKFKSANSEIVYLDGNGSGTGILRFTDPNQPVVVYPYQSIHSIGDHSNGLEWFDVKWNVLRISHDDLASWSPIDTFSTVRDIASPDSGVIIVVENNQIHKSTDYGNNWNTVDFPNFNLHDIYFINDSIGYLFAVVGSGWSVYRTNDGGTQWTLGHSEAPLVVSLLFRPQNIIASDDEDLVSFVCYGSNLWASTNQGQNFSLLLDHSSYIKDVAVYNKDTFAIIDYSNKVKITWDGGINFFETIKPDYYRLNSETALFIGPTKLLISGNSLPATPGETSSNLICLDLTNFVGVKELNRIDGRMYPNPSSGPINLEFDQVMGPSHVVVYDIQGQNVFEELVLLNDTYSFHLDARSGVYIIQVTNDKGVFSTSLQIIE